ncbi:FAD binding domain-containing protein [Streptomyces abyssomicinicus]|uniref:FAD binding domain-containing protein n=1 Tax=Streptomyces abyssomicinicus TaxID=574929 RepID=UPI00124FCE98|nr:FAD binding domain-containing protein [Streptomyces abyssomicinicus]
MDLTSVREVVDAREAGGWRPGDAWLAGGTALFAEPRPHLLRLRDLTGLGWPPLTAGRDGLTVAATCTVAELLAFAEDPRRPWPRGRAFVARCCRAFSSSFKIWNTATVGGNICLALPAGPMISMAVALDGRCRLVSPDGSERTSAVEELVCGNGRTRLAAGELLRDVTLPAAALERRTALRRVSLQPHGRSAALVTVGGGGAAHAGTACTVTAATVRPVTVRFPAPPSAAVLRRALEEALPPGVMLDDVHGHPAWRRHLSLHLAEQARRDLAGETDREEPRGRAADRSPAGED